MSLPRIGPGLWLLLSAVRYHTTLQRSQVGSNEEEPAFPEDLLLTDVNHQTGACMRRCLRQRGCCTKKGCNVFIVTQQSAK